MCFQLPMSSSLAPVVNFVPAPYCVLDQGSGGPVPGGFITAEVTLERASEPPREQRVPLTARLDLSSCVHSAPPPPMQGSDEGQIPTSLCTAKFAGSAQINQDCT